MFINTSVFSNSQLLNTSVFSNGRNVLPELCGFLQAKPTQIGQLLFQPPIAWEIESLFASVACLEEDLAIKRAATFSTSA